jgi:hypothetical protein
VKIPTLSCKTPRDGLVLSTVFFLNGLVLLLCGRFLAPDALYLPGLLQTLGLVLMPFAAVILVSALRLLATAAAPRDPD